MIYLCCYCDWVLKVNPNLNYDYRFDSEEVMQHITEKDVIVTCDITGNTRKLRCRRADRDLGSKDYFKDGCIHTQARYFEEVIHRSTDPQASTWWLEHFVALTKKNTRHIAWRRQKMFNNMSDRNNYKTNKKAMWILIF